MSDPNPSNPSNPAIPIEAKDASSAIPSVPKPSAAPTSAPGLAPVVHVNLTASPLSISEITSTVRSPKAGAIVIFAGTCLVLIYTCVLLSPAWARNYTTTHHCTSKLCSKGTKPLTVLTLGTTRDSFADKAVATLSYSAYETLALRTMTSIAQAVAARHSLLGIAIVHRLGSVPIGEESVVIAVAAPHRRAAWLAGEEALEEVKAKVEIWKMEVFAEGGGVWRANRDGVQGERIN